MIDDKVQVGVVFCGGCNPYFDREQLYRDILLNCSKYCDFILYAPDQNSRRFDFILLINGCESACLFDSNFHGKVVIINNVNYNSAIEIIRHEILHS